MFVKVPATFTMRFVSNCTQKMTNFPIEINGNLDFETFSNWHNVTNVKNLLPQINLNE